MSSKPLLSAKGIQHLVMWRSRVAEGTCTPLRPLRTGRETLASSGSYTPASGRTPCCHRTNRLGSRQAMRPCFGIAKGLASDTGSSHRWLAGLLGRSVGSLPSAGVTRLRRYYEPVRPCASHRYSAPQGSAPWRSPLEVSLGIEATGSHVPHKSLSLVSRRLHAGRRSASRQASAELCRRPTTGAWFWRRPYAFDTSATVHSRSSDQRTPDGIAPAFCRNAHHLGHWTDAACGGLDPDPAIRARGADPHLLCSKAARS